MSKAKTLLLSGALTLGTVFTAHAQSAANDDGKLVTPRDPVKTEAVDNKKEALEPCVREGELIEAFLLSEDHKLLVIYISGGKGRADQPEPLTAQQYAERLVAGFGDKQYTKYPTDIVVIYEETGNDRITVGMVMINGRQYFSEDGERVFSPIQIANNVGVLTSKYAKMNGVSVLGADDREGLAPNQPD